MSLSRYRVNYEGSERVDLPDFLSMLNRVYADFDFLVKSYIDNEALPRVIKRYQEGTHTTNTFKIKKDLERSLQDSNQQWLFVNSDGINTTQDLTVLSGQLNYIEVKIQSTKDDLQTRAFWNTDIGLTGQEFFDDINIRLRFDELFRVTQSGFAGGDWIPLYVVSVDNSGLITSASRADDLLWKNRVVSLPSATTRLSVYESSIKDLRSYIDFVGAFVSEIKGLSQGFESSPWSNLKILREYQNIVFSNGGNISWNVFGADTLTFDDQIFVNIAGRSSTYSIGVSGNNNFVLAEGDCVYASIPEVGGPACTVLSSALSVVPISPLVNLSSPTIVVLFYRKLGKIFGLVDLDLGESAIIGESLPTTIRSRLGILSKNSYQTYLSTNSVQQTDDYATAISRLDSKLFLITSDSPLEEIITVPAGGQTIFNALKMNWVNSNQTPDVEMYRNGQRLILSPTGLFTDGDFKKNSGTQLQIFYTIPELSKIVLRREKYGLVSSVGNAYFVQYLSGQSTTDIILSSVFDVASKKLRVYRNGLIMINSIWFGQPAGRYVESGNNKITLALNAQPLDYYVFVNQDQPVYFKTPITGLTGTSITTSTYTLGNSSLFIWRNSILMNASAIGPAINQYTETNATTLTLASSASASDVFVIESATAPSSRQDATSLTGTTLTLANPYIIGAKTLLVYKNGLLMVNSLSVGPAIQRYQEATTTTISLAVAAVASDVFTFVIK